MNEVEKMSCEIIGIRINGLFGKTNISFDLSKDCTILIGENGIGKTTALKMLENILDEDYISLASYYFESIEFISNSSDFKFEYKDFLLPIQIIEDAFYNANNKRNNEHRILRKKFKCFLDELVNKNLLGQFLHDIYYLEYAVSIRNIVKKYFDIGLLDNLKREMLISTDITSYKVTKFYKSGVYKIIRNSTRFDCPIFSDMVNKVVLYDGEDSFAKYKYSAKTDNECKDFKYVYWKCNSFAEIENKINLIVDGDLSLYLEYPEGRSVEMDSESFLGEYKVLQLVRENKMQTGFFDINSAIKCLYFSIDEVQQINNISVDGLKKNVELLRSFAKYTTEEVKSLLEQIDETVIYIHKQYIFPLLAEENPFKFNIEKIINDINAHLETNCSSDILWESIYLLESYMMVYKKLASFSLSKTYINNKITALESFVKEFIKDKALFFTPAGVSVYSTELNEKVELEYKTADLSFEEQLNMILGKSLDRVPNYIRKTLYCSIGNENSRIQLSKLSSGESKIIALAFYTMISNCSILIMDEPELSTSIIWQEKLVPAIIDYGEFSSVVIATHSPYIVRDPSLNEYIEYLP